MTQIFKNNKIYYSLIIEKDSLFKEIYSMLNQKNKNDQ